jgi:hypothetical protein
MSIPTNTCKQCRGGFDSVHKLQRFCSVKCHDRYYAEAKEQDEKWAEATRDALEGEIARLLRRVKDLEAEVARLRQ